MDNLGTQPVERVLGRTFEVTIRETSAVAEDGTPDRVTAVLKRHLTGLYWLEAEAFVQAAAAHPFVPRPGYNRDDWIAGVRGRLEA